MLFLHLLDDRPCHALYAVRLALEGCHGFLEGTLLEVRVVVAVDELFFGERTFHGEHLEELFAAALIVVALDDVDHAVPDHVGDVHADALAHQGVAALLVDHGALLVHHVVVFEQALADAEVVLLDLLLCTLDALRDHRSLDALSLLEAETVHHGGDALGCEQTHQLVFKRHVEHG